MMDEKWLTTKDAARLVGYHIERIRELLREEKIVGRKFGPVWQVERDSLLTYVQQIETQGSKTGPKPAL
jgi:excisionase family DNA binding protein